MRATAPREVQSGPHTREAASGPQGQSSRSPLPGERRESLTCSPHSPLQNLQRQTTTPPNMPEPTPIRQTPSSREEDSPMTNVITSDLAESHRSLKGMFIDYAKGVSVLTSLELRKDEAKRLKDLRCAEFDRYSSLHGTFPSAYETQLSERYKANEYFEALEKEYKSQERKLSEVSELMAARVVPSNKGMDPAQAKQLQERCLNLENELGKTLGELKNVNSELASFKSQVNHKIDGYEERLKQPNGFEDLQRQVTDINAQVKQLQEARSGFDEDALLRKDELENLKKDLATTTQNFKMLNDETSALDLHGMRNSIDSTAEKVNDVFRQIYGDEGFQVRLGLVETESREMTRKTENVSFQQLGRLITLLGTSYRTKCQLDGLKSRIKDLGNMEAIITENFLNTHENAKKADKDHDNLQARITKLEQAQQGGLVLTQQAKPTMDRTVTLQTELREYGLNLAEKAESNEVMSLRINGILARNGETTLPAALNVLDNKNKELQRMVKDSMDNPEQLQCRHISTGIDALATSMDLLSFRIEQEERDLVLLPELSKIGLIDNLAQKSMLLETNFTKLLEEQKTVFGKHLEEQKTIFGKHLSDLRKRIEDVSLSRISSGQSNNTHSVLGSSLIGFNPHFQSSPQQSHGQPPQYAIQPNGIINGAPNGSMEVCGPHIVEMRAEISRLHTKLINFHEATTIGINNLDNRMNNLSTSNVVKFMANHLHNMYPDARNATVELSKLRHHVDDLHKNLKGEIGEVRSIADVSSDISDRIKTLEKAHAESVSRVENLERQVGDWNLDVQRKDQNFAFEQLRDIIDDKVTKSQDKFQESIQNLDKRLSGVATRLWSTINAKISGSQNVVEENIKSLDKRLSDEVNRINTDIDDMSTDYVKLREDVTGLQKGGSVAANNNAEMRINNSDTPVTLSSRLLTAPEASPVRRSTAGAATHNGEPILKKRKKEQSMLWRDESDEDSSLG